MKADRVVLIATLAILTCIYTSTARKGKFSFIAFSWNRSKWKVEMLRDIEDGCVTVRVVGFNHYSLSLYKGGFILPR